MHSSRIVAVLKHSTRCSVSRFVLKRLEEEWTLPSGEIPFYILDLLAYRNLSDAIARKLNVVHESPQLLLIAAGKCICNRSHEAISASATELFIRSLPTDK